MPALIAATDARVADAVHPARSQGLTVWFVSAVAAGGTVLWSSEGAGGAAGAALVMLLYFVLVGVRLRWRFGEDAADSLYFLGFLFTVSLLAFSFLRLDGSGKAGLESVLAAVGQGLLLTVWGLLGRQVAILHSSVAAPDVAIAVPALMAPVETVQREPLVADAEPVRAPATQDDAARESSAAARKLKVVASQLESAAAALASAGQSITQSTAHLVESVEQSSAHISGASLQSARDITSAAQVIREQLQSGVTAVTSDFASITQTLDTHGKMLREVTETESNAALASLRKLNALGEETRALATSATQAVRASARLLADQANAMPDPRGPAAQYSEALITAATAIQHSGVESARAAQAITSGLGDLSRRMKALSDETGGVVDSAKEALAKTRGHFELFRKLEDEYVKLVEDVSRRAPREKERAR